MGDDNQFAMSPTPGGEMTTEPSDIDVPSASAMEALGKWLAAQVRPGDWLLLYGDIGAGKTVLVRALALELGHREWRGSPTFTLINEYGSEPPFAHIDLYRLMESDLEDLGLEELAADGRVVAVEWAERGGDTLRSILPERVWEIVIEYVGATGRSVHLVPPAHGAT